MHVLAALVRARHQLAPASLDAVVASLAPRAAALPPASLAHAAWALGRQGRSDELIAVALRGAVAAVAQRGAWRAMSGPARRDAADILAAVPWALATWPRRPDTLGAAEDALRALDMARAMPLVRVPALTAMLWGISELRPRVRRGILRDAFTAVAEGTGAAPARVASPSHALLPPSVAVHGSTAQRAPLSPLEAANVLHAAARLKYLNHDLLQTACSALVSSDGSVDSRSGALQQLSFARVAGVATSLAELELWTPCAAAASDRPVS